MNITISCYWNPCRWKSREQNYDRFRNQLGNIPHATIELSQDGEFDLADEIHVQSSSWLWHKERLLNVLAQKLLKQGYKKIIWLDADIEFENKDWFEQTIDALDRYPVVQPFSHYVREGEDGVHTGAVFRYNNGKPLFSLGSGFACGINADLWQKGLYELGLIGGGDVMFLKGCVYGDENWLRLLKMNPFYPRNNKAFLEHFIAWCEKIGRQNIQHIPGVVKAFWHGSVPNRKYAKRHLPLTKFAPTDLTINEDQMYEWATENGRQIGEYIKKYMFARKEDACTLTSHTQ